MYVNRWRKKGSNNCHKVTFYQKNEFNSSTYTHLTIIIKHLIPHHLMPYILHSTCNSWHSIWFYVYDTYILISCAIIQWRVLYSLSLSVYTCYTMREQFLYVFLFGHNIICMLFMFINHLAEHNHNKVERIAYIYNMYCTTEWMRSLLVYYCFCKVSRDPRERGGGIEQK